MMSCIFCKIVEKQLPTKLIYENAYVIAFDDIHPRAPTHKLIIPRKHIATLNDTTQEDIIMMGHLLHAAQHIAKDLGFAEQGYRTVINCNKDGGQEVYHIHLHLLAGRALSWPPG